MGIGALRYIPKYGEEIDFGEIVDRPRLKVQDGFYSGQWKKPDNNKDKEEPTVYQGFGKIEYGTYGLYEGQWLNGKAHGIGRLLLGLSSGKIEAYCGEWEDNFKKGRGF